METINLDSEIEEEIEFELEDVEEEETVPEPEKVDWSVFVDKEMPNWHPKFKRAAISYLLENNPKSVTLTDKPIASFSSVVIMGGKEGIREFIVNLEEEGYNKVTFNKFSGVGIFAIMEVKK